MSSLVAAMGLRNMFLRRAWKIREPGRYGYITLEHEGGVYYYSFICEF
jgi:hypothetical protein